MTAILTFGHALGPDADGLTREDLATSPHGPATADSLDGNVHSRLVHAAGFTDPWNEQHRDEWNRRYAKASRFLGLAVLNVPRWDRERLFLSAAYIATPADIDGAAELTTLPAPTQAHRTRLAWALDALDLYPMEPRWHLLDTDEEWYASPTTGRIADRTYTS